MTRDAAKTRIDAIDRLADLVAKSLVAVDVSGAKPRFRLLDTTRAYALEKLGTSGERQPIARRHAEYCRQLFARAEVEAPARATGDWLADYGQEIDNLRAALDWTFSPGGETSVGVALAAAALPLWIRLSLLEECRGRTKQALSALGTASTEDPREAMRLHAALGASTPEASEMGAAFTKTLDMAKRLGDVAYQLRALSGLSFYHNASGRFRLAQPFAQEFQGAPRASASGSISCSRASPRRRPCQGGSRARRGLGSGDSEFLTVLFVGVSALLEVAAARHRLKLRVRHLNVLKSKTRLDSGISDAINSPAIFTTAQSRHAIRSF